MGTTMLKEYTVLKGIAQNFAAYSAAARPTSGCGHAETETNYLFFYTIYKYGH
tara:strand:+ start:208 stop:366 length:159 start_codon:yes stop_codon:yes gene_type:complete